MGLTVTLYSSLWCYSGQNVGVIKPRNASSPVKPKTINLKNRRSLYKFVWLYFEVVTEIMTFNKSQNHYLRMNIYITGKLIFETKIDMKIFMMKYSLRGQSRSRNKAENQSRRRDPGPVAGVQTLQ